MQLHVTRTHKQGFNPTKLSTRTEDFHKIKVNVPHVKIKFLRSDPGNKRTRVLAAAEGGAHPSVKAGAARAVPPPHPPSRPTKRASVCRRDRRPRITDAAPPGLCPQQEPRGHARRIARPGGGVRGTAMAGQTQERATVVLAWRSGLLSSQREPRTVRSPHKAAAAPTPARSLPAKQRTRGQKPGAERPTSSRVPAAARGQDTASGQRGNVTALFGQLCHAAPQPGGRPPPSPGPAPSDGLPEPDAAAHAPPTCRDTQRARHDPARPPRPPAMAPPPKERRGGPRTIPREPRLGPPPSSSADTPGGENTALRGIYLCPGAFPGTPPPPQSRRRCSATFFLAAEESPTSEGLQTKRFWSLAEEKLAGFQCSWQTLGGLHFSICRREQKCVCLHRLLAPPPRRPPPPAHRHYWRGWALQGVRLPVRSECKCYVIHYQM